MSAPDRITAEMLAAWQENDRGAADTCTDIVEEVLTLHPSKWSQSFWRQAFAVREAVIAYSLGLKPACDCVLRPASELLRFWYDHAPEHDWRPLDEDLLVAVVNAPREQLPPHLRLLVAGVRNALEVAA